MRPWSFAISRGAASSRRPGIWDGRSARSRAVRRAGGNDSAIGFAGLGWRRTSACSEAVSCSPVPIPWSRRPWSNPRPASVVQFVTCQTAVRASTLSLAQGVLRAMSLHSLVKGRFGSARHGRDGLGRRHLRSTERTGGGPIGRKRRRSSPRRRAAHRSRSARHARRHPRRARLGRNGTKSRCVLQCRGRNDDHSARARGHARQEGGDDL